ncbi:membrane protein [Gordonia phage Widow]|nr:membrane protein [Gordonia phage Widow]
MAHMPAVLRFTGLQLTSLITGVMAIVMGLVYFGPDALIRRPLPPGQVSIVVAVESFAPVWPILFTAMGMALIGAVTSRRFVLASHVLAVFGWSFYAASILIGALLSEPPTPIVTGTMSLFVALVHFGLIHAHQDEDGYTVIPADRGVRTRE